MKFYLGMQKPKWWALPEFEDVPLFIAYPKLAKYKRPRRAKTSWVLDSGGFNQLRLKGAWSFSREQYADDCLRYAEEIGNLDWVAPMDWMCEDNVLAATGLDVWQHQKNTVKNFLYLRERLGDLVVPVLQGWTVRDYMRCIRLYDRVGVDLRDEHTVGVGSVCRRNSHGDIMAVLTAITDEIGPRVHAFGVKGETLVAAQSIIRSSDSLAWSLKARYERNPGPECTHVHCGGCMKYALRWREQLLERL